MRRARIWRTVRNWLLVLLILLLIWLLLDRPLPLEMEYRRAERACLMEKKEILWQQGGCVLSRDAENLYLFQRDGYFVLENLIQSFPLEDSVGVAMARRPSLPSPLIFYAYAGGAASASLHYAVTMEGETEPAYLYDLTAETGENGVFCMPLELEPVDGDRAYDGTEFERAADIYSAYQGFRTGTTYTLTVTFLDAEGTVMAVYECEGGGTE